MDGVAEIAAAVAAILSGEVVRRLYRLEARLDSLPCSLIGSQRVPPRPRPADFCRPGGRTVIHGGPKPRA